MEKKEITVSSLVNIAGITIVPVSRVSINARHGKRGTAFYGSIQPDSVIIITPSGKRAFRVTGEEVTLDQLAWEFPDISEKLEEV
jgi:uncharacterized spore protein YtfJ